MFEIDRNIDTLSNVLPGNSKTNQECLLKWKFRQVGKENWHNAQVPGCNFTDLLENRLIEDPFYRDHESKLQWIEKEDWEYTTNIHLKESELDFDRIQLVFEGLDTYADVYLNDTLILKANNMFIGWKVDVKNYLQPGVNAVRVYFHSPLKIADRIKHDITYPAGNDHSKEKLSVYTRKAPYHYGWDWGPRFVSCGIWRPISLQSTNHFTVEDIHIRQSTLTDRSVLIETAIEIDSLSDLQVAVDITCETDAFEKISHTAKLNPGKNDLKISFSIKNPRKWWPKGMGDPYLYTFRFDFGHKGEILHSESKRIGIRTVEVINEPDEFGESFYFIVNGTPLFIKGVNYIPQDSFVNKVEEKRYHAIFQAVAAANMNMIRVWGGGIYETDLFYDLADEHGILVWQDFMFACTMYPGDQDFLSIVEQEAVYNIKRLRNHPSLAIWCGNNEIKVGWESWGWKEEYGYSEKDEKKLQAYYTGLFERSLPDLICKYDPDRFYLPSSPISDFDSLQKMSYGDNHYWGVWHRGEPFSAYRIHVPRFMSEYGFQSFPLIESVRKYSEKQDQYLRSEVMQLHQKHPKGNEIIDEYLQKYYKKPKDFESFLYLSQVLQAEGIKTGIEAHRRKRPFCMGTLYWQLNDCWPVASWSSVDYYGKWKALHYFVKKAYDDILISIVESSSQVECHLVSDRLAETTGKLKLELRDFKGNEHFRMVRDVVIKPNHSEAIVIVPFEYFGDYDPCASYLHVNLEVDCGKNYDAIHYFKTVKDLKLEKPDIKVDYGFRDNDLELVLSSQVLVKNLYVSIEDNDQNFSDNFFDLIPGQEKKICITQDSANFNKAKIRLISVSDTYEL